MMKSEWPTAPDNIRNHRALHMPYCPAPFLEKDLVLPENIHPSPYIAGLVRFDCPMMADEKGYEGSMVSHDQVREFVDPEYEFAMALYSANERAGILRGIHVAYKDKLGGPVSGSIFAAFIDLRLGSPTFGNVHAETLTAGRKNMVPVVLVPRGCGNSYMALEPNTIYKYEVTTLYEPREEVGIMWDDPRVISELAKQGLGWPIMPPELSKKDASPDLGTNFYLSQLFPGRFPSPRIAVSG